MGRSPGGRDGELWPLALPGLVISSRCILLQFINKWPNNVCKDVAAMAAVTDVTAVAPVTDVAAVKNITAMAAVTVADLEKTGKPCLREFLEYATIF